MNKLVRFLSVAILLSSSILLNAQTNYKMVRQIPLEGDGGWDYLSVDEAAAQAKEMFEAARKKGYREREDE